MTNYEIASRKKKARNTKRSMKKLLIVCALCCANIGIALAALDGAKIDQITGLKGKLNDKEGVYKVTCPRSDVKVVVDGWTMPPFMGLGTWAGFTGTNERALMMGDTVLFEDEVNPVISVALDQGLSVTALHNHFFFDHPKVYFMHIEGQDSVENWRWPFAKFTTRLSKSARSIRKPANTFAQKSLGGKKFHYRSSFERDFWSARRSQRWNG